MKDDAGETKAKTAGPVAFVGRVRRHAWRREAASMTAHAAEHRVITQQTSRRAAAHELKRVASRCGVIQESSRMKATPMSTHVDLVQVDLRHVPLRMSPIIANEGDTPSHARHLGTQSGPTIVAYDSDIDDQVCRLCWC